MHFIEIGNGKILDFDKIQIVRSSYHTEEIELFTQDYKHLETILSKEEFSIVLRLCSKKILKFKNFSDIWNDSPYYVNVDKIFLVQRNVHCGVPGSNKEVTYVAMENGAQFTMENGKYKEIVRKIKDQNF